jgi:hypothetical protein
MYVPCVFVQFYFLVLKKPRKIRWAEYVAYIGEKRDAYKIWGVKCEGKRPLGRPRHRWEDCIKINLKETGWEGMGCIYMAQYWDMWQAVMDTIMDLWVL